MSLKKYIKELSIPVNFTSKLKKLLNAKGAYDILDSSKAGKCSWTQGGCGILSYALYKAYGFPMYQIYNKDTNKIDHIVNKLPNGEYLDYDGSSLNKIKNWKEIEEYNDNLELKPLPDINYTGEIVIDDKAAKKLAKFIKNNI